MRPPTLVYCRADILAAVEILRTLEADSLDSLHIPLVSAYEKSRRILLELRPGYGSLGSLPLRSAMIEEK